MIMVSAILAESLSRTALNGTMAFLFMYFLKEFVGS